MTSPRTPNGAPAAAAAVCSKAGCERPATSSIYGLIMLAVGVPLLAWAVIGLARESRS